LSIEDEQILLNPSIDPLAINDFLKLINEFIINSISSEMNEYLKKEGKLNPNIKETNKENLNDENQIENSYKHKDSDISLLSSNKDNAMSDNDSDANS
jgi:hypothetical protein